MNYYNEIDNEAAEWIGSLVESGWLPKGHVDTRSVEDVTPNDIAGYTQCHFFAGIGGWSRALYLANVPSSVPLWTGSCPCQPFSASGKGNGVADERHLWPSWFWLIEKCRPAIVLGEQVAPAIKHGWLDGVFNDLEGIGYACGSAVLPACSVGAPHKRDRIYFVAHRDSLGAQVQIARRITTEQELCRHFSENRPWDGAVGIRCEDGKTRRVEPGTSLLANGIPRALATTCKFGNAIVPQLAAAFITAAHGPARSTKP